MSLAGCAAELHWQTIGVHRTTNPQRPVAEPLMLRGYFRFRGIADMEALPAGSTRSRMTPKQTYVDQNPACSSSPNLFNGLILINARPRLQVVTLSANW